MVLLNFQTRARYHNRETRKTPPPQPEELIHDKATSQVYGYSQKLLHSQPSGNLFFSDEAIVMSILR